MANPDIICRLCFKKCNDFSDIKENTMDILNVLLKIDLDIEKPVMCENCAKNHEKCFKFKSACLYAHGYVFAYIRSEESGKLNLKVNCLGKKENHNDIPVGRKVCHCCMDPLHIFFMVLDNEGIILLEEMLKKCLPELKIHAITNPVICTSCYASLQNYFCFITNYSYEEENIKKCCKDAGIDFKGPIKLTSVPPFLQTNMLMSAEDYSRVNRIKENEGSYEESKNTDDSAHKNENFVATKNQIWISGQPGTSKGILPCDKDDNICNLIKTEQQICDGEIKIENKNENFIVIKEEIEIKTEQHEFDSTITNPLKFQNIRKHILDDVHKELESPIKNFQDAILPQRKDATKLHDGRDVFKLLQCDLCSFQTGFESALKRHKLIHKRKVTMYPCDTCPYETKHIGGLVTHLLTHKKPKVITYQCSSCSYQTESKYGRDEHKLIHKDFSEVTMYKCESCSYRSKSLPSIVRHQKRCEHYIAQKNLTKIW